MVANKTSPRRRGRASKFCGIDLELVCSLAELGATDKQIASALKISVRSVNKYKKIYPDFSQSIKKGKDLADSEVKRSLFQRAKGYEWEETKTVIIKNLAGKVTRKEITKTAKFIPADTAAAFIWLKNRQSWKDRPGENDVANWVEILKQFAAVMKDDQTAGVQK
jgi:hypothetical protein